MATIAEQWLDDLYIEHHPKKQGGVINGYRVITHGHVMAVKDSPKAAQRWIDDYKLSNHPGK